MQETSERPYHHGDLRRTIIETAMDMLDEEQGWQFTLREVARRAGVSHAAPYKHFADKGALLAEMAMLGFDRLREKLTAARRGAFASHREEFLTLAHAYVGFGTSSPALYRLMFGADAGKAPDIHSGERALAAFGVMLETLERSQREGVLRKRAIQGQATTCWALVHGLTMLSIGGLLRPEKVGPDAIEAALVTLLEGLEE
ncbi:TetR/AcrR family transcriptional regulator [Methylosinus sporium]|uniref:TetR/AcrR family transcriptional regulator n=1 Tax=Methylosinus sporium TaxID=428 RepID=A0A549SD37_METSR|nr:TetR/AcrR family transcriptional regulator [Methylosinus sporium]TRL23918.1 TetR/AcrR family transcriptional regulator [Methylosinus sporium]